jgi:hypothetical protein
MSAFGQDRRPPELRDYWMTSFPEPIILQSGTTNSAEARGHFAQINSALRGHHEWLKTLANAGKRLVLTNQQLASYTINNAQLIGAVLTNLTVSRSSLSNVDLSGSKLTGVSFDSSQLRRAHSPMPASQILHFAVVACKMRDSIALT